MSDYAEILTAALTLPPHQRTELAEVLLDSTDTDEQQPEISAEWREEIARRSAAYVRGELKGIPWSKVRDEIRQKCQRDA